MDFLKVFDAYSLRARLIPAVVATAPATAALALLISWKSFGLSNAVASTAVLVLLFAIADLARASGRALEQGLYSENGGMPSVTMFRRSDSTLDDGSKERYRAFLAAKLGVTAPSAEQELVDQAKADAFYEQCGVWLRQNTRDTKRFPLLFAENVTYGFRRNLLGVKRIGLGINVVVAVACLALLWRASWDFDSDGGKRISVVLLVAVAHAAYMLIAVRRHVVWDSARAYGRELVLCCEALLPTGGVTNKARARKKVGSEVPPT